MPKNPLRAFLVLAALAAAASAHALTLPDSPTGYVTDTAGMLSPATVASLDAELAAFDRETSTQVFVATFPSLDGEVLEDVSIRLFEKWKPGLKDKNNGVLLAIFRDDRQLRIEVGYGLEGALPDAIAKIIIENEIVPSFKAGRVDEGVQNGARAILRAVKGEYSAPVRRHSISGRVADQLGQWAFITFFVFPVICYVIVGGWMIYDIGFPAGVGPAVVAIFFLFILRTLIGAIFLNSRTVSGKRPNRWMGGFTGGGFSGGGGSSGRGFGGGFSGGGGGGGGGGGASGRW